MTTGEFRLRMKRSRAAPGMYHGPWVAVIVVSTIITQAPVTLVPRSRMLRMPRFLTSSE